MNLSDKMSYLKGLVDGMELDLTTKAVSYTHLTLPTTSRV